MIAANFVRQASWRRRFALAACAAVGLSGAACSNSNRPISPMPMQHPMLEHVPLPSGFRLVDDKSRATSTGEARWAQCVFSGRADRAEVYQFFEANMPAGGWKLREKHLLDGGVYELHYESQQERCDVRIWQDSWGKAFIEVDLRRLTSAGADAQKTAHPQTGSPP